MAALIDLLIVALILGFVVLEVKREAGHSLLDTLATLAAVALSTLPAGYLTARFQLPTTLGQTVSPMAYTYCFLGVWAVLLLVARRLHLLLRWTMHPIDPLFGLAFGLCIAVIVGHVATDLFTQFAALEGDASPNVLRQTWLAEELHSFRTYRYVMEAFEAAQYAR